MQVGQDALAVVVGPVVLFALGLEGRGGAGTHCAWSAISYL